MSSFALCKFNDFIHSFTYTKCKTSFTPRPRYLHKHRPPFILPNPPPPARDALNRQRQPHTTCCFLQWDVDIPLRCAHDRLTALFADGLALSGWDAKDMFVVDERVPFGHGVGAAESVGAVSLL